MAVGLLLPVASIQAWPTWLLSGAVSQKVQEKAKETHGSIISQYAWAGTQLLGKAAAKTAFFTAKHTVKFAWNYPRVALSITGIGYLYLKINDMRNWYNQINGMVNVLPQYEKA